MLGLDLFSLHDLFNQETPGGYIDFPAMSHKSLQRETTFLTESQFGKLTRVFKSLPKV